MCGICGIVDFSASSPGRAELERMLGCIAHRGPDDAGVLVQGPVALGHRRLSIIDLSDAGHQPMVTEDGLAALVYNGEVYNFAELRRELEAHGVQFRSRSDTEVVLRGFVAWGPAVFARLNGMFALALWDARTATLYLARDRTGIKPLYYGQTPGGLVFGSEIKAILASERVAREPGWAGLHTYAWFGAPAGGDTAYAGVRQLLPGRWMEVSAAGTREHTYWSLAAVRPVHDGEQQAAERVRALLEAAVARHLIADVPVGVFLSGGIDSSAITALASRHHTGRLKTYSVGFDFVGDANELPAARRVAEHFGTEHHELFVAGSDLPATIERLVRAHDQPFGDAADIPLYLLCAALEGSVKVVLQGDGGDEVFAGYRRYAVLRHARWWRAARAAAAVVPPGAGGRVRRMRRFARAAGHPDAAMRMALLLTTETPDEPPLRVFSPQARAEMEKHDPFAAYRAANARHGHLDPVQRMLYTDMEVLLPDTYLEKVDRSTMAHSIEVRVPFLDAEVVEYAAGLPAEMKVSGGRKKWLLRQALRGTVPDAVLDGRKTGFGVPFEQWLRGPLAGYMRQVLTDPATLRSQLFDAPALERAMGEHVSGARNHGYLLWKVLNLALWHREYMDGGRR